MILKNNGVLLREIERRDCDLLMGLMNDPEIASKVVGNATPVTREDQLRWLDSLPNETSAVRFIVEDHGTAVGTVTLSGINEQNSTATMNVKLVKTARGRGVAYTALKMLRHYAFSEMNLNCLTAQILADNLPSQRLFEKLGFRREGMLRARVVKAGQYKDVVSYSLLRAENDA